MAENLNRKSLRQAISVLVPGMLLTGCGVNMVCDCIPVEKIKCDAEPAGRRVDLSGTERIDWTIYGKNQERAGVIVKIGNGVIQIAQAAEVTPDTFNPNSAGFSSPKDIYQSPDFQFEAAQADWTVSVDESHSRVEIQGDCS